MPRAPLKDGAPAGLARADVSRRSGTNALVLKHLLFACAQVGYAAVTRQTGELLSEFHRDLLQRPI